MFTSQEAAKEDWQEGVTKGVAKGVTSMSMLKAIHGASAYYDLEKFIQKGSFASYICKTLGRELNSTLESIADEEGDTGWGFQPVDDLYILLKSGWNLDHNWFKYTDDIYRCDDGIEIPPSVLRSYSASEQMASYGMYLLREAINDCGPIPDDGENEYGWGREGVQEHEATCLILARHAMACAQQLLLHGVELTTKELEAVAKLDFSAMGKNGAAVRHAPMRKLQAWAVDLYRAGNWPSANQAAHDLKSRVIEYGRTISADLKEQNAQRTIAEWFRKSV